MIKVGIIGAGRIGHVHGESISKFVKNATVKTIADPFMNEKTEAWAKSLGVKIICGHDYANAYFGVTRAVDEAFPQGVETAGMCWKAKIVGL